jgi:magnesium transporter
MRGFCTARRLPARVLANEGSRAARLNIATMIAYCAHYRDGKRVASDLAVDRAAELARSGDGFVWLAVRDPSREELESVATAFDLPMGGIDGRARTPARPRLEGYKGRAVLTMRSARFHEPAEQIEFGDVRVLVAPAYVISVWRGEPSDPAGARERLEELHPDLIETGPGAVVWAILDEVIDGYEPVAAAIDDGIERLEQQVFSGATQATQATYSLTRETIEFHRSVTLLQNPLDSVVEGELVELPDKLERFLRDAASHLRRIEAQVAGQRDILSGILDANLALISVRQNETVQKISAWAAIVAVPTFLASIWGMNFTHMPELDLEFGYPVALGAMLAVTILLYRFFRRIQWL